MAIKIEDLALLPVGKHRGIITNCEKVVKEFHPGRPEEVVEVTIQPKARDDGTPYGAVSVIFTPSLNPLSGLAKLLKNLGVVIDFKKGGTFEENSLISTAVTFTVKHEKVGESFFPRVAKESIVQDTEKPLEATTG